MSKLKTKRPSKGGFVSPHRVHGEELLRGAESITVKLEDGQVIVCNLQEELCIPDDPVKLRAEALRSSQRYAFWAYQAERALRNVRRLEAQYDREYGINWLAYRKYYREETDEQYIPKEMMKASVDVDSKCHTFRVRLDAARNQYGVLRVLRDALASRDATLRRLLDSDSYEERMTR